MNPNRAQRTWTHLSTKWINSQPWGTPAWKARKRRNSRKIKKGVFSNFIPVEVVNAITGEIAKGYMRDISAKRLRKWLEFHNQRAQVEQVYLPPTSTFFRLQQADFQDFPILIKLGKYQVPYLIVRSYPSLIVRGKQTVTFDLKTVDNLKYLEVIADRKAKVMAVFGKIRGTKKLSPKKDKRR